MAVEQKKDKPHIQQYALMQKAVRGLRKGQVVGILERRTNPATSILMLKVMTSTGRIVEGVPCTSDTVQLAYVNLQCTRDYLHFKKGELLLDFDTSTSNWMHLYNVKGKSCSVPPLYLDTWRGGA